MGMKRLTMILTIITLVLGLGVVILMQAGADQKLLDSFLPRVEKRFEIDVQYGDIETSLSFVTLKNVTVRSQSGQCRLLAAKKVDVGMRLVPLFMGEIDLTDIRVAGLDLRIGTGADGCGIHQWKQLRNREARESDATPSKGRRGPEIHLASGKLSYENDHIALMIDNLSGSIGDDAKSVIDLGNLNLRSSSGTRLLGKASTLKYDPENRHLSMTSESPTLEIQVARHQLLLLARDIAASIREAKGDISPASSTSNADGMGTIQPLPAFLQGGVMITVTDASCTLVDETNPKRLATLQDISVDVSMDTSHPLLVRSNGQLPGTNARFGLALEIPKNAPPHVTVTIPELPLSTLGPMICPSPHINWRHGTLQASVQLFLEDNGNVIKAVGQSQVFAIGIDHPRIALSPLSDLNLAVDFDISYHHNEQILHLDRMQLSRKLAKMNLSGDLHFDRLAFDLALQLPPTKCQHLKEAVADLFPTRLARTRLDGHISLDARLSLDELEPESVSFVPNLVNRCRIVEYGDIPDPSFFRGPFHYTAYTEEGADLRLVTGFGTDRWAPLKDISPYLIEAITVTEDGKFWKHSGITIPEITRSIELNLKKGALRHGASTITMQLAKNLFLGRERTIARKLQEVVFVWYLETHFSKEELLELYFNIVEFGPSIYGIRDAALHYFGREPYDLNALESVFLVKLLPSPVSRHRWFEKGKLSARQISMLHRVLHVMRERGRITDQELAQAQNETIVFHHQGEPLPEPRPGAIRSRQIIPRYSFSGEEDYVEEDE